MILLFKIRKIKLKISLLLASTLIFQEHTILIVSVAVRMLIKIGIFAIKF